MKGNFYWNGEIRHRDPYKLFLKLRKYERLVPKAHAERNRICAQVGKVEAVVASNIIKRHILKIKNENIIGRPEQAHVTCSVAMDKLQIFFTEEYLVDKSINVELVELISEHLQIKDPMHQLLLSMALSGTDLDQVRNAYLQYGIHVPKRPLSKGEQTLVFSNVALSIGNFPLSVCVRGTWEYVRTRVFENNIKEWIWSPFFLRKLNRSTINMDDLR